VVAFDANPLPREIQVGQIPDRFSLVQPDIARSPVKDDPRTFNSFQMNQFRYEGNSTVRFDNLMTTNRGPITNALSTSQPVILRRAGAPDQVIEPGEAGGRWDPLRWYMVMNGYRNFSPPFVTGGVLYMAGDSMIPSLFENGFSGPPTRRDGLLFGLYAKFSPNDAFLIPNSVKPWMKQATTLGYAGRHALLAPVLQETYDFPVVARISAGPDWARWNEAERSQLIAAVTAMSTATYASRFNGYSGERFETLGEGPGPRDTVVVKTRIVRPDDSPVALDYVLGPHDGGWRIVDVLLDGKYSELAKQRAEFGAILKNAGLL